jgi:L-alanine-DL-glutamate epimerase-like enolase superfamily enzyme
VTAETVDSARAFASVHAAALCEEIVDVASLEAWMSAHALEVDENPAAWCAIELAVLDVLARAEGRSVDALLSRPAIHGRFHYSAVLGDASPSTFRAAAEKYRRHGFSDFKVKLSGDLARDRAKLAVLREYDGVRVRADANNLWRDAGEALAFLQALEYPFVAIEEPIRPDQYDELARLARALKRRVILDESLLRASQLDRLKEAADSFIVNVRVSKMGGLLRSPSGRRWGRRVCSRERR